MHNYRVICSIFIVKLYLGFSTLWTTSWITSSPFTSGFCCFAQFLNIICWSVVWLRSNFVLLTDNIWKFLTVLNFTQPTLWGSKFHITFRFFISKVLLCIYDLTVHFFRIFDGDTSWLIGALIWNCPILIILFSIAEVLLIVLILSSFLL